MDCNVYLGGPSEFTLQGAILVYRGENAAAGAFAAWHEVESDKARAPRLGPAQSLSRYFLKELSRCLGAMIRPEILPENVLVRTPDMLVWWQPAQRRKMFFRHGDELDIVSGRMFPQPALVYRASNRELWIRALADSARPTATTALNVAPYYNVNTEGVVCQGTMRSPEEASVAAMPQWEQSFFESEFTHIRERPFHTASWRRGWSLEFGSEQEDFSGGTIGVGKRNACAVRRARALGVP